MIRTIYAAAVLLASTSAFAQQQAFAPFTIDEQTYTGLMNYLGEVPSKYANPVITTLIQKEQAALAAAKTAVKEPEPKPTKK